MRRLLLSALIGGAILSAVSTVPRVSAAAAGQVNQPGIAGPGFAVYTAPPALDGRTGEPSIGADWKNNKLLYQSSNKTLQVSFDDAQAPGRATWIDVSPVNQVTSLDPILFTDLATSRTFVANLVIAGSLYAYSDDAGATWTPGQGGGPQGLQDHQTVGGGPYAPPLVGTVYPNMVYYCSQDFAEGSAAFCSASYNGGLTFGPGVPTYTINDCVGLHGHIRVAPSGLAMLPNQGCGPTSMTPNPDPQNPIIYTYAKQSLITNSADGAGPWTIHQVPDSKAVALSDPAVAAGANGTIYFAYQDGGPSPTIPGGHGKVAVSRDGGNSWDPSVDLGAPYGVQNIEFPEVIAGDDNRAAVAFLGATAPGSDQADGYNGVFYLYISMTYDGGKTWTTINAFPNDPVQRGCISLAGTSPNATCSHRNLLDFNDISVDRNGRVVISFAEGCTGACETNPAKKTYSAVAQIARQYCGRGLFAARDRAIPACPAQQLAAEAASSPPAGPSPAPPVAPGGHSPLPNTGGGPGGFALVVGLIAASGAVRLARSAAVGRGHR